MSLGPEHLQYPERHYGMDHDRYDWSMLSQRKSVSWPEGKKLALWVNVCVQFFPLDQKGKPYKVPGGMTMPYPDLRHFSLRDYGNRVGIFRIMKALDKYGITPTFSVNGEIVERTPYLFNNIVERGNEIIAHGWNMDCLHHNAEGHEAEGERIVRTLEVLRNASGQAVTGWLSPARNESEHTPDLLAEQGIGYLCDWVNDDMPYPFRTANGPITALPLSTELEDMFILMNNLHSEVSYVEQVLDASEYLLQESETQGGRLLALNIHPWMLGQPHRIGFLEQILARLSANKAVWSASASEIVDAWHQQQ